MGMLTGGRIVVLHSDQHIPGTMSEEQCLFKVASACGVHVSCERFIVARSYPLPSFSVAAVVFSLEERLYT